MTVLKVDGVSKQYKNKTALAPSSFEADAGTCVVLCGGNGAGKSTLLQIIGGILAPSTGRTAINKKEMQYDRDGYLNQLGYMPDEFHAQDMMTVTEFLSFYGAFRKVKRKRVDEVMEQIGLAEKKKDLVRSLSKGMKQRLLLGQSILANPPVLLLDEPTNGLDPYWVNRFVELINTIKKGGTTIVFSTHMMDVAAETGDLILFMKQGEIVQRIKNDGNVEETTLQLMKLHRK